MLARKLAAEFIGTAFLVAGVVGSGIMAERLSDDVGLQLLENAFATAGVLLALILALGPVSGAHFNPVVTLAERVRGSLNTRDAGAYIVVQVLGGALGAIIANLMFDLSAIDISGKDRSGSHLLLAEGVATIGLLLVIYGVVTAGKPHYAAATVAGYIGGAYWFTASTSFANPAVTIARTLSDTFAGIDPANAVGFVIAQLIAGGLGIGLIQWLFATEPASS
ncbi:MAG: MIP/aquaporin family protein [Actinomycetota bacterium]